MVTDVYIYDAIRTPRGRGKPDGALHEVSPIKLVAGVLRALEKRNHLKKIHVDSLLLGCVTPIGEQGADIAKTSAILAGWHYSIPGIQLNSFCASGLEAINIGAMRIASGSEQCVAAGGIDSMSRYPLGSDGYALLTNPDLSMQYNILPQGVSADLIATLDGFSREDVDQYALRSHKCAYNAWKNNYFKKSIVPVYDDNHCLILDHDEHVRAETSLAKLLALKPAFADLGKLGYDTIAIGRYPKLSAINHVHTPGNSSGIVDGCGILLLGNKEFGEKLGIKPRAKIIASTLIGSKPTIMLTGPVPATLKVLEKAQLSLDQIDLFEVNEAFASVVLHYIKKLKIPLEKVNVNGGAIAMGHPVGATGAMLLGTLVDELERRELRYGLCTLCAAGGMAVATIIERIS
jgi:acetyl-CoA C-acetyltransferase